MKTVGGHVLLGARWHFSPKPAPCPGQPPGHVPTATPATQQALKGQATAWALGDIRGPKVGGEHEAEFFVKMGLLTWTTQRLRARYQEQKHS